MFMRCCICGGSAHPALKHVHGTTAELCYACSQRLVRRHQQGEQGEHSRQGERSCVAASPCKAGKELADVQAETVRAVARMAALWRFAA